MAQNSASLCPTTRTHPFFRWFLSDWNIAQSGPPGTNSQFSHDSCRLGLPVCTQGAFRDVKVCLRIDEINTICVCIHSFLRSLGRKACTFKSLFLLVTSVSMQSDTFSSLIKINKAKHGSQNSRSLPSPSPLPSWPCPEGTRFSCELWSLLAFNPTAYGDTRVPLRLDENFSLFTLAHLKYQPLGPVCS